MPEGRWNRSWLQNSLQPEVALFVGAAYDRDDISMTIRSKSANKGWSIADLILPIMYAV